MGFKAVPFTHPELSALNERSKRLASLWFAGHMLCVFATIIAIGVPLSAVEVTMIDSELKERVWEMVKACFGLALFSALAGFLLKRYAVKKGKGEPLA